MVKLDENYARSAGEHVVERTEDGQMLHEMQRALTVAKKSDVKVRKLEEEKVRRTKQWEARVKETKRKFQVQRQNYVKDQERLSQEQENATAQGRMAAAQMEQMIAEGGVRVTQAVPDVEAEAAWNSLTSEAIEETQMSGFLRDALSMQRQMLARGGGHYPGAASAMRLGEHPGPSRMRPGDMLPSGGPGFGEARLDSQLTSGPVPGEAPAHHPAAVPMGGVSHGEPPHMDGNDGRTRVPPGCEGHMTNHAPPPGLAPPSMFAGPSESGGGVPAMADPCISPPAAGTGHSRGPHVPSPGPNRVPVKLQKTVPAVNTGSTPLGDKLNQRRALYPFGIGPVTAVPENQGPVEDGSAHPGVFAGREGKTLDPKP